MINLKNLVKNVWSQAVHKTGDETITGNKAFTGGMTVGGYEPECVVDTRDRCIRYNNGIQIVWGLHTKSHGRNNGIS